MPPNVLHGGFTLSENDMHTTSNSIANKIYMNLFIFMFLYLEYERQLYYFIDKRYIELKKPFFPDNYAALVCFKKFDMTRCSYS